MSDVNVKLKRIILKKLEQDLGNKVVVPNGMNLWIVDPDNQDWFFNVTSAGSLEFNQKFFTLYSNLFSIDMKILSKILKEWFEIKFGIRIHSSMRRTSNLSYIVEIILESNEKKKGPWNLGNRFGFSYDVVKRFLNLQKNNKFVVVENFIFSE
jgi:hypothetical protein